MAEAGVKEGSAFQSVMEIAQRRGFFWPSARDVYSDAPAGFWIHGPLGVKIKRRIVELWRKWIVKPEGAYEFETPTMLPLSVFKASGHLEHFVDRLVKCTRCHSRWRAEALIEDALKLRELGRASDDELMEILTSKKVRCPVCGASDWSGMQHFNLMFLQSVGAGSKEHNMALRPETTQGSAVEFKRCFTAMRGKLPFVLAQLGRAYRNEISPRRALLRMREFQMLEVHVFFDPEDVSSYEEKLRGYSDYKLRFLKLADATSGTITEVSARDAVKSGYTINEVITYWLALYQRFFNEGLGFPLERIRYRELGPKERSHYAFAHWDLEAYSEDLGWVELVNNAYRTDYDLSGHARVSGTNLEVLSGDRKVIPHLYEPSIGIDRVMLFELLLSYRSDEERRWLRLPKTVSPLDVGIFPLVKRNDLPERARKVAKQLSDEFETFYDESGSIGRRYRRMDEIGTPACVTIDYQTLDDGSVTVRDRDTMKQVRLRESGLVKALGSFLAGTELQELGEPFEAKPGET